MASGKGASVMKDPLFDPLSEVVSEFGRATERPSTPASDLEDLRDGLAGMRTDLRQVPEQVGQAISASILRTVSVALSEVGHLTIEGSDQLLSAIRDEVARAVRDQMRDVVRDGVRDGLVDQVAPAVEAVFAPLETRLVQHLDDAVLKLAESLMRHQLATLQAVVPKSAPEPEPEAPQPAEELEPAEELDSLIDRITPPATLSDAVSNAVELAKTHPELIPLRKPAVVERPHVEVPRVEVDSEQVEELLASWREPRWRTPHEVVEEYAPALEQAEAPEVLASSPDTPKKRWYQGKRG